MSYGYTRVLTDTTMEDAEILIRHSLEEQGFGILTEIDVKATLEKKIGAEIDGYRILGACSPRHAHRAITAEPRIGVMLPCNVILRELPEGTEVTAIDPLASMSAVENDELMVIAAEVTEGLKNAVDRM
jgi:uncharacterized protein (DUF302 family)